jgi:hypothetical protein
MWQKLKEQIPAILITAALVVVAASFMVKSIVERQQAELAPLRAQNERLAAQAEDNRQHIAAAMSLLREAIAKTSAPAPVEGGANVEKMNEERLARLAQVIAERVIPSLPAPQSPAEVEATQNRQVDKVADRLAANIKPVLANAIAEQQAATATVAQASEKRIQQLNVGLLATQAAARDALRLSQELAGMYTDSVKDQGVLMRLFSLPASLVMDAANLNFVATDRAKVQRELSGKVAEIENRLKEVQVLAKDSAK